MFQSIPVILAADGLSPLLSDGMLFPRISAGSDFSLEWNGAILQRHLSAAGFDGVSQLAVYPFFSGFSTGSGPFSC